jgi:hypothetical protein
MPLIVSYFASDLSLSAADELRSHLATTGTLLAVTGFSCFVFTLLLHAAAIALKRVSSDSAN